jgi:uncharacterized membrane protein YeaQ/YmgE (transglycosylase-associated protein family)
MSIVWIIIIGFLAGALAKLAMPGKDSGCLGLRIVQTLIESHSGKIDLGETQKGTLFTLQFPLV